MNALSIVVSVLPSADDARRALRELKSIGVGIESLTLIGKGSHVDEQLAGYYGDVAGPTFCGQADLFWQSLWSLPTGSGFVYVPALGTLVLAGELSISIVRQLHLRPPQIDGARRAPLGAALQTLGIPHDAAVQYEAAVRADQVLVIARREADAAARIAQVLQQQRSIEVGLFGASPVDAGSAATAMGVPATPVRPIAALKSA